MADSKSPMKPATNYFICTLGEAAEFNAQTPHRFKTINELVDQQSREIPLRPAVAFPVPPIHRDQVWEEWGYNLFTYGDLRRLSLSTAEALSIAIAEGASYYNSNPIVPPGTTVALLCPSSVDFLFTWLGLMRLGYAVLMIAWVHPSVVSPTGALPTDAWCRDNTAHNVSHQPLLIFAKPAMSHYFSMMRYTKGLQRLQQSKKFTITQ